MEQDIVAQEEAKAQDEQVKQEQVEKKNFSFENVMLGVSGVLNKIEKKVENTTWIELESPLKKVEENLANETDKVWDTNTQIAEPEQTIQSTNEQAEKPEINESSIEKNNEEYLSESH